MHACNAVLRLRDLTRKAPRAVFVDGAVLLVIVILVAGDARGGLGLFGAVGALGVLAVGEWRAARRTSSNGSEPAGESTPSKEDS